MFFTFSQNNSFGVFHGPAQYVIIEADSADEANYLAVEMYDIYFDGCESGQDCSCCGDRWSPVWDGDREVIPSVYGESVENYVRERKKYSSDGPSLVVIYYKNGEKKEF